MSAGIELYREAKKIIPGGTQLLSKRPEMFLPDQWPAYYQKAKGVEVWDLDGNKFIDMSIMGVGACILGYADDEVNAAVIEAVNKGSMCTLNAPEEVELARLLLAGNPWAGMVRYTRTGGESMAVAVRIARAYTGKEKVVFCGYHGWSDWYLAANVRSRENLNEHLLEGLAANGVPRSLGGTAIPFKYNDIQALKKIVEGHQGEIAAVIIEPVRYQTPVENFFNEVREIARQSKAVLIFDEITSGFRIRVGGAYQDYQAEPDIVVYGKALGNGYPIGAIVGRTAVMNSAQDSFISSTFWTERIGPAAAIRTLQKLREKEVPQHLGILGRLAKDGWRQAAARHGLAIEVVGLDPIATFHFEYGEKTAAIHTLFTQEMLRRGYLASKQFYVSFSHTEEIVQEYLSAVDDVFGLIRAAIDGDRVEKLLLGPIAHSGFKRLN